MQFMLILKANRETEADVMPSAELLVTRKKTQRRTDGSVDQSEADRAGDRLAKWAPMEFPRGSPAASARAAAVISESIGIPPHLSLPLFCTPALSFCPRPLNLSRTE